MRDETPGQAVVIGEPLKLEDDQFDWEGLVLGFQKEHPDPPLCAVCGRPIDGIEEDGEREIPFWMYKRSEGLSIAFHVRCGFPRINLGRERGFAA